MPRRRAASPSTSLRRSSSPAPSLKTISTASTTKKSIKIIEYSDDDEDDDDDDGKEAVPLKREPTTWKKILTRTVAACAMITMYLSILSAGHLYCILLVFLVQIELYRELVNVRYVEAKELQMPWFRTIQWSWFFAAIISNYGEGIYKFLKENEDIKTYTTSTLKIWKLTDILKYHGYFFFLMYCILFICTVLTLKVGIVRFQISQFMWSIVTICLVVFQVKYFTQIALCGLFWYFFPMATVVMNDVSAYFCGITFGRKFIKAPFLSLSPNKTWEGFIGAAILTLIFSWYWPLLLSKSTWFTCPAENLSFWPFPESLQCDINPVFLTRTYTSVPLFGTLTVLPIQVHGLYYGLFASLVAPFGGFMASAIKRAYHKKDFDSLIAGHGGLMDRMDCQLMMLAFTAFHYRHFIVNAPSIKKMIDLFKLMGESDQLELINQLKKLV